MKPLDGTFAANAQEHGVAGLNVDGARLETGETWEGRPTDPSGANVFGGALSSSSSSSHPSGRWPANLALDEDAAAMLDGQSGITASGSGSGSGGIWSRSTGKPAGPQHGDSGGASRFFYTAKASRSDRGVDNDHPTVKPSDLMKWLCTLTSTPTGGTVLDPFMGSGTTIYAAKEMGRKAIGIELEERYCEIAAERCLQGVLPLHEATP